MGRSTTARDVLCVLLLSFAAVLLHGYHFGVQDHFQYLPVVRHSLDPTLYPHDAQFFLRYARYMIFDELVAGSIRLFRLPIDWAFFLWHLLSIYLYLLGCWMVAKRLFTRAAARWAAVILVAVLLILVAAGTLLHLADVYLVPRTLATACLLFALAAVLDRKPRAIAWLVFSFLVHPTMTLAGIFHLWFIAGTSAPVAAALAPLVPGTTVDDAWLQVLHLRRFIFPLRWPWIAWVAAFAPLGCLWWFRRLGERHRLAVVAEVSRRLLLSGSLGIALGTLVTVIPGLERAAAAEPMRVLHLLYLLTVLLGGGMLGELVLRQHWLRWAALLLPLCVSVFIAQRMLYPSSPHIEWPGRVVDNDWVRAFDWVRKNTPPDALFALDPHYTSGTRQDTHSFRALAVRSQLADYRDDRMTAAIWPDLAPVWLEQMRDLENWPQFGLEDFQRLKRKYGVGWVIVEQPGVQGLDCPYANDTVVVCRIP